VIEAFSGEAGLAVLRSAAALPQLILLDLKTTGMSGFDTLRKIRADIHLKDLVVVVLTSSSMPSDIEKAYKAGANTVLFKTVGLQLRRDLNQVLGEWIA